MFQAKLADFISLRGGGCVWDSSFIREKGSRESERRVKQVQKVLTVPDQLWQLIPEVFNELFLLNRLR